VIKSITFPAAGSANLRVAVLSDFIGGVEEWMIWPKAMHLHGTQTGWARAPSCTNLFCPPTPNMITTNVKITKQTLNQ
jgi:hypothetical protein